MLHPRKSYPDCFNCDFDRCKQLQKDIKELTEIYKIWKITKINSGYPYEDIDSLYEIISNKKTEYNEYRRECAKFDYM